MYTAYVHGVLSGVLLWYRDMVLIFPNGDFPPNDHRIRSHYLALLMTTYGSIFVLLLFVWMNAAGDQGRLTLFCLPREAAARARLANEVRVSTAPARPAHAALVAAHTTTRPPGPVYRSQEGAAGCGERYSRVGELLPGLQGPEADTGAAHAAGDGVADRRQRPARGPLPLFAAAADSEGERLLPG